MKAATVVAALAIAGSLASGPALAGGKARSGAGGQPTHIIITSTHRPLVIPLATRKPGLKTQKPTSKVAADKAEPTAAKYMARSRNAGRVAEISHGVATVATVATLFYGLIGGAPDPDLAVTATGVGVAVTSVLSYVGFRIKSDRLAGKSLDAEAAAK